ncbi:MAG TPA: hypothetical protein VHD87_11175, partial [Acidimicrobiales bacterium]|nr:hypothetical protein [Acidimicrobiales bacterium]
PNFCGSGVPEYPAMRRRLSPMSERPAPDPKNLLEEWMKWERGEIEPGRLIANLKKAGLRDVLEQLATKAGD